MRSWIELGRKNIMEFTSSVKSARLIPASSCPRGYTHLDAGEGKKFTTFFAVVGIYSPPARVLLPQEEICVPHCANQDPNPRRHGCPCCQRLGLPEPIHETVRLFSGQANGLAVRLPVWQYPAVFDLTAGSVQHDNFNGQ